MIKTSYKINFKKYDGQIWCADIWIDIKDYNLPSPEDEIFISLSTWDGFLYDYGCTYGKDESMSTPGGDLFGSSYKTPLQMVHAINLILREDYLSKSIGIPEVGAFKKQLMTYQLKTGEVHLISDNNKHRIALQLIETVIHRIVTYPFEPVGTKLNKLYSDNPNKIVPNAIHRIFSHLMETKTKPLISVENFKDLVGKVERGLMAKQELGIDEARRMCFFSSRTNPLFPFYLSLINEMKGSGLLPINQQDIADQIDYSIELPSSLSQLISSYVCN